MSKRLEHMLCVRLGNEAWKALEEQCKSAKEEFATRARRLLTAELLRSDLKSDFSLMLKTQSTEFHDSKEQIETLLQKHNFNSHSRAILRSIRSKAKRIDSRYPMIEGMIVELNKNVLAALDSLRELLVTVAGRQEKLTSILARLCEVIDELKHEVERVGA